MRTLTLLLVLLTADACTVSAQDFRFRISRAQAAEPADGARIESIEITFPREQLNAGVLKEIDALVGTPLDRTRTGELVTRIEEEHADLVAAIRVVPRPNGEARVVFLVARIGDDEDLESNINARYTVESVEIAGVLETRVSQDLRDRMQKLVGSRLDPDEALRLDGLLTAELPGHEVRRRLSRGKEPGRIRLVFEVTEAPWLPFAPNRTRLIYHGTQGWGGGLDLSLGLRNDRFEVGRVIVGFIFGIDDEFVEEYSGYRLRFENRHLGTRRVGIGVEMLKLRQTWEPETLSAIAAADIPEAYRARYTVEPTASFAFNSHLRLAGGVSFSSLESLSRSPAQQAANAGIATIGYDQEWRHGVGSRSSVSAGYETRAGTSKLGSSLLYTKDAGHVRYRHDQGDNTIIYDARLGRITGQPPLFERFTLGDSRTLRGWHKFDIATAGGDRMVHQSVEYRWGALAVFLDAGSVWTAGTDARLRLAAGIGVHADFAFITVGVPLNADKAGAIFMAGFGF